MEVELRAPQHHRGEVPHLHGNCTPGLKSLLLDVKQIITLWDASMGCGFCVFPSKMCWYWDVLKTLQK